MSKILTTIFLIIFLNSLSFSQTTYSNQTIEEILKLPEEEINIGIASLVLAKEFYPKMNVKYFLEVFDFMAEKYRENFGSYSNPDEKVRALNTFLYKKGYWNDDISFSYDDKDLEVTKLDNKFINGYLSSKKGSCITMPLLYVILGERLGFPIYPVRSAKHFFVRYIPERQNKNFKANTKNFKQNIETTNGGGFISDKQYKEDVLLTDKSIKNGVYLRTLSKKEYIASLLLINANEYIKKGKINKAKKYFELSIKYDSTFSSAYWNYGITAFREARELEEKLWNEKQQIISSYESIENKMVSSEDQVHLQMELGELEKSYEVKIKEKIAVYKKYIQKAESLGIVHKFPLRFFQKQIESIKKYNENGGY